MKRSIFFVCIRRCFDGGAAAAIALLIAILFFLPSAQGQSQTNQPIFQFEVLYNSLLEFTWSAPFTINGRTHANGDIFVGSSQNLNFTAPVTTAGGIYKTNWDGHPLSAMTGAISFPTNIPPGSPGYLIGVAPLRLPIGTNQSAAAYREIVEMPPLDEDPNSPLAQSRYYNKAGIVVLVSNASITVLLKNSPSDLPIRIVENFAPTNIAGTNRYTSTNFPWLTLSSNAFVDFRENQKKVKLTDIDVSVLKNWLPTNTWVVSKFPPDSGLFPNICYVADLRSYASFELPSVRVKNGAIVPTNGWTLATPNPLYVLGHYNLGPGGAAGTNDTSKAYPTSLISDALTVLSTAWNDRTYTNPVLNARNAVATTVNAALLTGIVYSTATDWTDTNHYSGGFQNMPRLIENWAGDVLTVNGSFVNFYPSVRATNFYQNPGIYYNAPNRLFSFDQNFNELTKLPPGTPVCGSPPSFIIQPSNRVALASTTVTLAANAICALPVTYQWQFNGANLPGAISDSLSIANIQPTQAGIYSVRIDSAYGSVFSSNALLTVSFAATLSDFAFSPDGYPQFSIAGVPGQNYAIQTSTNLTDWEPLMTNTCPFTFTDTNAAILPQRFYRAVYKP